MAPTVGQHTESVLRDVLGWDDDRLAAARREGRAAPHLKEALRALARDIQSRDIGRARRLATDPEAAQRRAAVLRVPMQATGLGPALAAAAASSASASPAIRCSCAATSRRTSR